jgi:YVTN family beta-propeller protein
VAGSTPEAILMGLYRIDPLSGDVDKPLPGAVYGVAVAEGFVWVVDPGGIRKINPDTTKEIASLPIGNNILDIEAGEGAVWAERRDGGRLVLYRVDPRTNDFRKIPAVSIQEPFGSSFLTTRFTVADGAVWVPDLRNEALIHVDASTLAVRRFDLPPGTAGVVAGEHQLWVRDNGARASVSRLDPTTGDVIQEITLTGGADGLAIGGGFVYVADTTNDIVVQIDPVTNTAFRTIQVGDGPRDLAFGDGFLWVVNRSGGTVSKVDPRTHQEVDTITVPATGGIAVGEEAVWVASCGRLLIETTCQ